MVQTAAFTASAFSPAVRQGFESPSLRPSGLGSSPIPVHRVSRQVEVPLVHTASSRSSVKSHTERRRLTPSSPALPAKNGRQHKDSRHVEVPLVRTASSRVPVKPSTEKRRKTPSSSALHAKKDPESSSDGSGESRSYVSVRLGPTSSQSCIKEEMPFKLWTGTAHERDFARSFVRSLTKDKAKAERFIRKHLREPSPPPPSRKSSSPPPSPDAQPHGGDSPILPNVVLPDVPDRSFSDCSGWESSSMANIGKPEEGTRLPLDDSPPAWMRIKRSNRVRRLSCDTPPPTLDAVCSPGTTVDRDVFVDESSVGLASCTESWDHLPEVQWPWSRQRAEMYAADEERRRSNHHWFAQAQVEEGTTTSTVSVASTFEWDRLPEIEQLWSRQRVEMYAEHEEIRRRNRLWLAQNKLDTYSTVVSEEDNSSLIWATYPGGRHVVGSPDDTRAQVNSPAIKKRPSPEECLERLKSWMKEKHGNDIFDRVVEREKATIAPPMSALQTSSLGQFQSLRQQSVAAQVPIPTPSPSGWSWKSISCLAATAVTVGVAIGVTACKWFS